MADRGTHSAAEEQLVGMQRLNWEETAVAGQHGQPHYDVVEIERICKPVILQPHLKRDGVLFYNHFV